MCLLESLTSSYMSSPWWGQRFPRPRRSLVETSSIWNLLCLPLCPTITSRSWKSTTKTLSGKHTNQVNPFAFLVIPVRYLLLAFPAAAFSSSGTLRTQPVLRLDCGSWQSLLIKTPLFCTASPHPLPLYLHLSSHCKFSRVGNLLSPSLYSSL